MVSSDLPPDSGRAILNYRYTWSCNPSGVLPERITTSAVGSYPTFSPLPRVPNLQGRNSAWGGYSLLHYYALAGIKPLTWTVLYVARTFLPLHAQAAIERTCRCKGTKLFQISQPCAFGEASPDCNRGALYCRILALFQPNFTQRHKFVPNETSLL